MQIDQSFRSLIWLSFIFAVGFQEPCCAMYGYIDKAGKVISKKHRWVILDSYSDGLALISEGKDRVYIDKNGKPCISGGFADAQSFTEGLAAVKIGKSWGQKPAIDW